MYNSNFLFVGLFVVAVTATVAQNSEFRVDPSTDFSKYKTYAWDQSTNTERVTTQVDAQLAEALQSELAKKGLRKVDSDTANLLICYHSNFGTSGPLRVEGQTTVIYILAAIPC
jgi:hypothetical protein